MRSHLRLFFLLLLAVVHVSSVGLEVTNAPSPTVVNVSDSVLLLLKYGVRAVGLKTVSGGSPSLTPTPTTSPPPIVVSNTASSLLASSGIAAIAVLPSLAAGASIGLGIAMVFYGYKLFRPTLFMSGFAFGGMVAYMTAERVVSVDEAYYTAVCWICFAVFGLVCGFLSIYVLGLGVFFSGAIAGLVLAFLMATSFGYKWWPAYPEGILFIFGAVLSLLFGALAYSMEKPILVVSMALTGAGATVWGVGYFVGGYANADDLHVYRRVDNAGAYQYAIPTSYWAYFAATFVLFVLGTYVQFMNTACCENNDLYTWNEHADLELQERRVYRERVGYPRYRNGGDWGGGVRTRDNYYHAHGHR
ncbi:hypothetical protein SPRG_06588 [Saprolegnia parasitica CBS 223.65]|uniref:Transmembrane protein 198 n=1 Tax=Saprolegnia parasitica (strain CBS 223.65) TaxID=695850 RepID=A0A067CC63_SAPPC|nr:hypothetical protein SPRG_06588 [Saprolegnia parasitica CBS 223.65]KDO28349.1 hypothetical protein SPRG_06588 [Saprolegnia parasitica CBS 223.65]|eukprot:XP_012200797.1 hypothetical protein SPRG_06588 [Saprolegnia parasitica CBS 223.65]